MKFLSGTLTALFFSTPVWAQSLGSGSEDEISELRARVAELEKQAQPAPAPAPANPDVKSKWNVTIYGFVELDAMWDDTQSFSDFPANTTIFRDPATGAYIYGAHHDRWTMGARNSRIGLNIAVPEFSGIKVTGKAEMDFLSNTNPGGTPGSEKGFFSDPDFRIRHMWVKMEFSDISILLGQNWQLFGWQSYFHPATVEIQGVPGQVYSRAPQLRVSTVVPAGDLSIEVAVAACRSPQRDSAIPDGQAGVKVAYNAIKGVHTMGGAGTAEDPAALGLSGCLRDFLPNNLAGGSPGPKYGWGLSADLLLPIIPATLKQRGNALSLTASYAYGEGIADLYSGLNPGYPNPSVSAAQPIFSPGTVDNGLIVTDGNSFRPLPIQSAIIGLQYYLPPNGDIWVSATASWLYIHNGNSLGIGSPNSWIESNWFEVDLFWDVTPAVRLGLCYAYFTQRFQDGSNAYDNHIGFTAFLIF